MCSVPEPRAQCCIKDFDPLRGFWLLPIMTCWTVVLLPIYFLLQNGRSLYCGSFSFGDSISSNRNLRVSHGTLSSPHLTHRSRHSLLSCAIIRCAIRINSGLYSFIPFGSLCFDISFLSLFDTLFLPSIFHSLSYILVVDSLFKLVISRWERILSCLVYMFNKMRSYHVVRTVR
jgi:hypothetical protein